MQTISPEQAFARQADYVWLTVVGIVRAILSDDTEPPPHQRFIVELPSGHTLLVAHNLDRAERIPLEVGDDIRVRGEYKWNEHGGILHWTHYDGDMPGDGGWVELPGRRANYS